MSAPTEGTGGKAVWRRRNATPLELDMIRLFYDEGNLFSRARTGVSISVMDAGAVSVCARPFPPCLMPSMNPISMEMDTVLPSLSTGRVVDHCYLCDMCFMIKCPYVPPHEWNVDFPTPDAACQGRQDFKQGKGAR